MTASHSDVGRSNTDDGVGEAVVAAARDAALLNGACKAIVEGTSEHRNNP